MPRNALTSRHGTAAGYLLVALGSAGLAALATWAVPAPAGRGQAAPERTAVTTHGEWVKVKGGQGTIRAYVAYPERKDKAPAVIVIHEIFGLTSWEPTVVDRLAANGYVAIVPDLLSSRFGVTPADPDSGRKLTAVLVPEEVTADLDSVYGYVNGLAAVKPDDIGTIGFCWGGGQAFRYATNNPALKAAVVCYGPAPDSAALARLRAPIYGVYGEDDARINASIPQVERTLKALGKTYTYDLYRGTGHGFLKPGRKGSESEQPRLAWEKIMAFYVETLGK